MTKSVTVRVPATTANCGPGFDCLGIALTHYNTFSFSLLENSGFQVQVVGEGAKMFAPDKSNLAIESMLKVFKKYQLPLPQGVALKMQNNVPLARGMGSSSSAIVAGVLAGNHFANLQLSPTELLTLANEIEGHPDNVAPALFGGVTLSYVQDGVAYSENISCGKAFKLVVVVPEMRLETKLARSVLPDSISMKDAIFNLSRAALFVNAIQSGKLESLKHALQDKLHQPYRSKLIPHMQEVFAAAEAHGAYGSAISGAGSTLIAFCPIDADHQAIGLAMKSIFTNNGIKARYHVLDVDTQGARII